LPENAVKSSIAFTTDVELAKSSCNSTPSPAPVGTLILVYGNYVSCHHIGKRFEAGRRAHFAFELPILWRVF